MASTPNTPQETTGRAVAALILSLLGVTFACPCIGSVVGIVLASGEKSDVGRAALILGWIGIGITLLAALAMGMQLFVVILIEGM